MSKKSIIDKVKLIHWLNVRKTTFEELNRNIRDSLNFKLSLENLDQLDEYSIEKIAEFLNVPKENLFEDYKVPNFIYQTKEEIRKTKRSINRGGIHFYNYYTLPSPHGYVAPVLIDILCPKEKMPTLNNGHLEPAITVSLGPNDIYARFAKKKNNLTFLKFKVNKDERTDWVVGSSYFEPSYCLHTYSRATDGPGKILSYTTKSNLENLFGEKLNDQSFKNFSKSLKNKKPNRVMFKEDIENKGYSISEIAKISKIKIKKIKNFITGKIADSLSHNELNKICDIINSDANLYIDKKYKEDKIGKYYYDSKDSIKTIRKFKSYQVASIASSKRAQDLSGYFLKVKSNKKKTLDLIDTNCSHYLVTKGTVVLHIEDKNETKNIKLNEGDAIWVAAYIKHGFTNDGALIKISDGQNINYLKKLDLINTYNLNTTLLRGRKDKQNWGYDTH